jgi:hypothetical protein
MALQAAPGLIHSKGLWNGRRRSTLCADLGLAGMGASKGRGELMR